MGRKQLKLIGSGQMDQMGHQSFQELKKQSKVSGSEKYNSYVNCIAKPLLLSMGQNPSQWEIRVFQDDSLNAFALPGNKIGVHTGMIEFAANQDQLAAVVGHEIGHVLAEHSNERLSQEIVLKYGIEALQGQLDDPNSKKSQMILGGLGLGSKIGVLLPFSRKHETEADLLGLQYMAKAGFDPRQASELWKKMKAKSSASTPEFLSTHPSNSTRIENLSRQAPKYFQTYQNVTKKPDCKL
jgi:predicted Zn-dependent protease